MDGTHRKILVDKDLGVPNGLYYDNKRQEICWGDAKTRRIECIGKDGSNRRVVTQQSNIYPFDLSEIRSNIYWSDWSRFVTLFLQFFMSLFFRIGHKLIKNYF
jgi:nidogen (entactin)